MYYGIGSLQQSLSGHEVRSPTGKPEVPGSIPGSGSFNIISIFVEDNSDKDFHLKVSRN
jgi:hypothetical protein